MNQRLQGLKAWLGQIFGASRDPARVLVVDDEDCVRAYIDRVLASAGYRTTLAASGHQALDVFGTMDRCDILVTDVVMPGMEGDELARRLRKDHPGLKVLYLTGFSDRLFDRKTMLSDGEAFLDKPCSANGLIEAVELLLFGRLHTNLPAGPLNAGSPFSEPSVTATRKSRPSFEPRTRGFQPFASPGPARRGTADSVRARTAMYERPRRARCARDDEVIRHLAAGIHRYIHPRRSRTPAVVFRFRDRRLQGCCFPRAAINSRGSSRSTAITASASRTCAGRLPN